MSEALKQAAQVLTQAKRLGSQYTITYRELGNPYYQKHILGHQAHAFATKLAEDLTPDVGEFVCDQRDIDGIGIRYRAEMVVLTRAQFDQICRAVNTAIRMEATRPLEIMRK